MQSWAAAPAKPPLSTTLAKIRSDEHATAARRVVNRIAHQVTHDPVQQDRETKDGSAGRDDAKSHPL
jgi:hypothetical protein